MPCHKAVQEAAEGEEEEGGGGGGSASITWAVTAQWVVRWAHCPACCSVAGSNLPSASGRGDFSLGVNMGSDSIP